MLHLQSGVWDYEIPGMRFFRFYDSGIPTASAAGSTAKMDLLCSVTITFL